MLTYRIMDIIYFIIGAAISAIIVWLLARSHYGAASSASEAVVGELRRQFVDKDEELARLRAESLKERHEKVEATTRLEAAQQGLEEQRGLIEAMKQELKDTFSALSGAALDSNNERFLTVAKATITAMLTETEGKLGKHTSAIDGCIKPLQEMLQRYDVGLRSLEEKRAREHGSLAEQLKALTQNNASLQKETANLVTALRKPQVRGRWGEMQLRRVAELSGMSGHCDFTEQVTFATDDGSIRPDMIVHLPGRRDIVVDAKVTLEAYFDALAAATEDDKKSAMKRLGQHVRAHIDGLAKKEYWSQFTQSPELVVMFLPGESSLGAALEEDPDILEYAMTKKVLLATPATFMALMAGVASGWRQEDVAKNADELRTLGAELYKRMSTFAAHLARMGGAISSVNDSYSEAVGSLESRVMPTIRKFKELGAAGGDDIPELKPVDKTPRPMRLEHETDKEITPTGIK